MNSSKENKHLLFIGTVKIVQKRGKQVLENKTVPDVQMKGNDLVEVSQLERNLSRCLDALKLPETKRNGWAIQSYKITKELGYSDNLN